MNKSALACCSCSFFPFVRSNGNVMLLFSAVLCQLCFKNPWLKGVFRATFYPVFPASYNGDEPAIYADTNHLPTLDGLRFRPLSIWAQCKSYVSLKILWVSLFHTSSFMFQFLTTFSWFFRLEKTIIDSVLSVFDKVN